MRASVLPQRKPSFAVASGARARGGRGRRHRRTRGSLRSHRENAARRLVGTRREAAVGDARLRRARRPRPRRPSPPPPISSACTHKRCRMCGNVCNVRVTACTSCCLPLVDRASWVPARVPRPGAASDSGDSSDDDAETDEDVDARAPTVVPSKASSSDSSRNESPTRDDGLRPWWLPRLGPNPARPPRVPGPRPRAPSASSRPRRNPGSERGDRPRGVSRRRARRAPRRGRLAARAGARARAWDAWARTVGYTTRAPPRSDAASLDHRTPVRTPGPDPATRKDTRTTETTTCSCR